MGRNSILVGYDGSARSRDAVALAEAIARPTRATLLLGWIERAVPVDLPLDEILEPIQAEAESALRSVAGELRTRRLEVETRLELSGSPARGLQELAEIEAAELVVVGSSHRGRLGQVLPGTVGVRLLHGSPCPVAIAPHGFADLERLLRRLVVAYDGSPEAKLALSWGENLAEATRADLRLLVVSEDWSSDPPDLVRAKRRRADRLLDDGLDRVTSVRAGGAVRHGAAAEELTAETAHADLLVAGSRGYGPLRRVLLGSVSAHLASHGRCPVVITPRAAVERRRARVPAGAVLAAGDPGP